MSHYPWAWTTPNAGGLQPRRHRRATTAARSSSATQGTPPAPNADPHDWAALVGSNTAGHRRRGRARPLGPAGPGRRRAPPRASSACDEGPFGKGTGGQLRYRVDRARERLADAVDRGRRLRQGRRRRAQRARSARSTTRTARSPRRSPRARSSRSTPSSRCRATRASPQGIDWGKQNIADLTQRAERPADPRRRRGQAVPARRWARSRTRAGSAPASRTTRGSSPPTPSTRRSPRSTVGQFEAIEDHARALRDVSVIAQRRLRQGRARDRRRRLGVLRQPQARGQHRRDGEVPEPRRARLALDRRRRLPRRPVSVRRAQHALRRREQLDKDHDGWPEGLGNVERPGMGEEKLDNTVYTIRGLYDLADLARSKGDAATETWARDEGRRPASAASTPRGGMTRRAAVRRLAEGSRQRAGLPEALDRRDADGGGADDRRPGRAGRRAARARRRRARRPRGPVLLAATRPYNHGLFHTACGGGPTGAGERTIFGLNTAIQAVGEGNYGRLGATQQKRYTDAEIEPMFGEPYTAATRCTTRRARRTSSPAPRRRSSRRRTSTARAARRERRALHALPLDGDAGVEPVRDHVAGRAPAARRAAGPRPRRPRRSCRSCRRRPRSRARTSGSATGALKLVQASRSGNALHDDGRHGLRAGARRLAVGHTLPRGSKVAYGHARRQEGRLAAAQDQPRPRDHDQGRRAAHGRGDGPLEGPAAGRRARRRGAPRPAERAPVPARCGAPSALRRSRPARGWRAGPARRSPSTLTA